MSEKRLWAYLRDGMKKQNIIEWEAQRIETMYQGVPDVAFTIPARHGWIELKFLKEWPVRPPTKIRLGHFSNHQRRWIETHGKLGGLVFVLIKVDKDYLLFDYNHVREDRLGEYTKEEMFYNATKTWETRINFEEFAECLLTYKDNQSGTMSIKQNP